MIVRINDSNLTEYRSFLGEAYHYLETQEWKRAYQFLKANNYTISEEDIDNVNNTFYSNEQVKKYATFYTGHEDSVYLIREEDRNEETPTFSGIDQYYNYIEYFKECDRKDYFLLKLPLDEGVLAIDANSRNIVLPESFTQGSIVQRDKVAETIVFTINRFIDNVDLANVDAIYVQWSAPDGNGGVREKATPIELIDLDDASTINEQKIKFGWPIDEDVTRFEGTVSFSVAFFSYDPDLDTMVTYRLNTLTSSFEVKKALQPEINTEESINRPHSALSAAIRNNKYPNKGNRAPLTPEFSRPGLDLNPEGIVEISAQLKAQAITGDTGTISYRWEHLPEGTLRKYDCGGGTISYKKEDIIVTAEYNLIDNPGSDFTEFEKDDAENVLTYKVEKDITVKYKSFGSINISYEKIADRADSINIGPSDIIYISDGNGSYHIYSGNVNDQDKPAYEKYTTYTLPGDSSTSIVGTYRVYATNSLGNPTAAVTTKSADCIFAGPAKIKIVTDLQENEFITKTLTYFMNQKIDEVQGVTYDDLYEEYKQYFGYDEESKTYICLSNNIDVKVKIKTLKVDLEDSEETGYTYTWKKKTTEKGNETSVGSTSSLDIREPGWYKLEISSSKNRKNQITHSKTCKAVFNPLSPSLAIDYSTLPNVVGTQKDDYYEFTSNENDSFVLKVVPHIGDGVQDLSTNPLYSDKIIYEWSKITPDSGAQILPVAENANSITVQGNSATANRGDVVQYTCVAKNILNNVSVNSNTVTFVLY